MKLRKRQRHAAQARMAILLMAAMAVASLYNTRAAAQQAQSEQLRNAAERSETAAKIINTIMELPAEEGVPREVVEKAEAVAVIPRVLKMKVLFQAGTKGYGVVSRRVPGGWTLPAYYGFGGSSFEASIVGGESVDLIIFFMNEKMVEYFQKGRFEFERERKADAGTVGAGIHKPFLERANVLIYTLKNGKLAGLEIENDFWSQFVLNPDNNINSKLYHMKGRDVLARKPVNTQSLPAGVQAYQQALTRYSVRP
jgi:lipid-binding SYLF domain-containing protein